VTAKRTPTTKSGARSSKLSKADAAIEELRAYGLEKYPGAHIKSPWPGHADLAVNDKTFAYLNAPGSDTPHVGCKLPHSSDVALLLPFVTPAGYGLAKSGWVNADFKPNDTVPVELMKEWLDESYRAQAPKKLIAQLTAEIAPVKKASAKRKAAVETKSPAKKKAPAKRKG
jgi:predicted DNA-binding protein (MmcQ/YjbR family)